MTGLQSPRLSVIVYACGVSFFREAPMLSSTFARVTVLLCLCSPVFARDEGISGYTLKTSTAGCGGCHSAHGGVNSAVSVVISGPASLKPGQVGAYSVAVSDNTTSSGGGVDIASSAAGGLAASSANLIPLSGELVQPSGQRLPTTYTFAFTAPATPGTVTLYATGMGSSKVDGWNFASNFAVTVSAAEAPPSATTGSPTGVGPGGATLHGTVNPNGNATDCYFEWGLTDAYGAKTPAASAGSGTTAVPVTADLSGLAAGVDYHYRLAASNIAGRSTGADRVFNSRHDLNMDGVINVLDSFALGEFLAGGSTSLPCGVGCADVNGDGVADALDLLAEALAAGA